MRDAKAEVKTKIQEALNEFTSETFATASYGFWKALGYESQRRYDKTAYSYAEFKETFSQRHSLRDAKALSMDWKECQILFQLTDSEIKSSLSENTQMYMQGLGDENIQASNIKSYLFAAIELDKDTYTRTELATLTREINRCFAMPVLILIKTGHRLTLSVINRRLHKKDSTKDVLEKVTLIKDIEIQGIAHRAHIEILFDLSIEELNSKHHFSNFDQLHNAWALTLDTSALSMAFYKELRNWFLWSVRCIRFPQIVPEKDLQDDGQHQKISAIRLLTRFMFCWFLKEKQDLVPRAFFDPESLKQILKGFDAFSDDSTYYQAILQNLFFATLSIPQDERMFLPKSFHGLNKEYGKAQYFRYHRLFIDQDQIPPLFSGIPFLNGGLFDCLDKKPSDTNPSEIRLDGFSNTQSKGAIVPNKLFWNDEFVDLSQELGSTKARETKVIGLIRIFEKYKFTVEENTPIDEEIALDPTLLGKAFEELLAYYNPETKEAAKNQTGSFYTPPYIADFMVTKSMRAYLMSSLLSQTSMNKADAGVGLDILLSYTEKEHAFNELETRVLVKAMDQCKAIDPACGSGAFLMGILHKMVFILQKLDKENKLWFEFLIENIPDEIKEDMRQKLSIENYTYVRKRGLIQKCIYGVDIQPIAIQIAKLRFFLTLLIEQDINKDNSANYGILPLPNLDFKLVCADSLLRFQHESIQEKDQYTVELANPYAHQLKGAVNEYFSASYPDAKQKKAQKIKQITDAVAAINISTIKSKLENYSIMGEKLQKKRKAEAEHLMFEMQQWQSYHGIFDNRTILFFEPQYQFPDVDEGFDIVIGNPPYIQLQKDMIRKQTALYEQMNYQVFERTGDIYCLFYERGFDLLKPDGVLSYITSSQWMRTGYGKKLRRYLQEQTSIQDAIDFSGYKVFKTATVDTVILIGSKGAPKQSNRLKFSKVENDYDGGDLGEYHLQKQAKLTQFSLENNSWSFSSKEVQDIKAKIETSGKPLSEWNVLMYRGILTGCNEAFIVDTASKDLLCCKNTESIEFFHPLVRGRDIQKYLCNWDESWIIAIESGFTDNKRGKANPEEFLRLSHESVFEHLKRIGDSFNKAFSHGNGRGLYERDDQGKYWWELRDCTYYNEFDKAKLIWKRIGSVLRFSYDDSHYYALDSTCIMTGSNLYEICAILNSKLGNWILYETAPKTGTGDVITSVQAIEPFRIPPISESNNGLFDKLKRLSMAIIAAKKAGEHDTTNLEREVDNLVFQLYGLSDYEIALVEKEVSK